jgi:protein involved in polysaccharide export with SLBB domain
LGVLGGGIDEAAAQITTQAPGAMRAASPVQATQPVQPTPSVQSLPQTPPTPAFTPAFTLPIDARSAPTVTPTPVPPTPSAMPPPPAVPNTGVETVQPVGGAVPPPGSQSPLVPPISTSLPFGSQLFAGQPLQFGPITFNRDYIVSAGDQISIQIWGSYTYSGVQGVDPQGNLFIPQVGPVHVAGTNNLELNNGVTTAVRRVFSENVEVYASLLSKQPVAVYVTGAVKNPGRYSGDRRDSPLQYILQAGGIDQKAGSYREIRISRGSKALATIDLYAFLSGKELPTVEFEVNDRVFVGPQRPTVAAFGDVQNAYRFEVDAPRATGADIIALAHPLPTVSDVSVQGLRDGKPFNAYLRLADFRALHLNGGDTCQFTSDYVSATIFVNVTGQSVGPSTLIVPRSAQLGDVLKLIEVDPAVADLSAIYLRRQSVAAQQKQALDSSLDRLRSSILTTRSVSTSDASIHTEEAQLLQALLEQVQALKPQGIVVLANAHDRDRVRFEPYDQIVIPAKSDVVLVTGEVRLPQTVIYSQGRSLGAYSAMAGGFTDRADTGAYVVLHTSGEVETGGDNLRIRPGDQIMIMPRTDPHRFAIFQDIAQLLYQVVISTGVTLRLVR